MRPAEGAVRMPANPMQTVWSAEGAVCLPANRLQTMRPAEGAVRMPVKVLVLLVPTRSRLPSILLIIGAQVLQVFREISRNVAAVNGVGADIPRGEIRCKAAALGRLIYVMEDVRELFLRRHALALR